MSTVRLPSCLAGGGATPSRAARTARRCSGRSPAGAGGGPPPRRPAPPAPRPGRRRARAAPPPPAATAGPGRRGPCPRTGEEAAGPGSAPGAQPGLGPAVLADQVGQVAGGRPSPPARASAARRTRRRSRGTGRPAAAPVGHAQQAGELVGVEDRHPPHAQALDPGGEPHVLDGAGRRGDVHLGQRAPPEHVALAPVHQRHHQHLAAVEDALDLQPQELRPARAQLVGGAQPLGLDQVVQRPAEAGSVTRTNRHGCMNPTLGACGRGRAAAGARRAAPGPGRKGRMSRRRAMGPVDGRRHLLLAELRGRRPWRAGIVAGPPCPRRAAVPCGPMQTGHAPFAGRRGPRDAVRRRRRPRRPPATAEHAAQLVDQGVTASWSAGSTGRAGALDPEERSRPPGSPCATPWAAGRR